MMLLGCSLIFLRKSASCLLFRRIRLIYRSMTGIRYFNAETSKMLKPVSLRSDYTIVKRHTEYAKFNNIVDIKYHTVKEY